MKRTIRLGSIALLASAIAMTGYAFCRGQVRQAAVLACISALETRVAANNKKTATNMATTVRAINYYTCLNSNRRSDMYVLISSKRILSRTQSLSDTLQALQRALRLANGEPATGPLRHPNAHSCIDSGTVSQLAKHLNSYSNFNQQSSYQFESLAKALTDFTATGRFTAFFAEQPPLGATLAGLTQLEALIWRDGAAILAYEAQKSGRSVDWYDPIRAFAAAESETVTPGAMYKARLFLMDNNLHYYTSVKVNGKALSASPFDKALLTFRVPAQPPGRPRLAQAQWRAVIQALADPEAQPYAADSAWKLEVPYFIVNTATP